MILSALKLYARAALQLPVELAKGALLSAVVFVFGAALVLPVSIAVGVASKTFNVDPNTLWDALSVLGALGWATHAQALKMKAQPVRI